MKKAFIFGIKTNRCVAKYQDAKSSQFQQVKSFNWNDADCVTIYLNDIVFPVKLLKKVFTIEDQSTGILCLVTMMSG
jgi:hypothetical protein